MKTLLEIGWLTFGRYDMDSSWGVALAILAVTVAGTAIVLGTLAGSRFLGRLIQGTRRQKNVQLSDENCAWGFLIILLGSFAVLAVYGIASKTTHESEEAEVQANASQQKERHLKTEVLFSNEVQAALSLMDAESVMLTLGRPDATSDEDSRWFYHNKVFHPITGRPDVLVIQFEKGIGNTPRVAYFQAGIGGARYSLR